jgi:hypothetical protein
MTPDETRMLQQTHDATTRIEVILSERCEVHRDTIDAHDRFINGNGDRKTGAKSRLDSLEKWQKRTLLGVGVGGTTGFGSLCVMLKMIWDKI